MSRIANLCVLAAFSFVGLSLTWAQSDCKPLAPGAASAVLGRDQYCQDDVEMPPCLEGCGFPTTLPAGKCVFNGSLRGRCRYYEPHNQSCGEYT